MQNTPSKYTRTGLGITRSVTRWKSRMRKQFLLVILLFSTLVLTSQPAGAQEASGPIYIVQPGDSLSSIAARFSVSLQELMAVNGITDPNQLAADQQLVIPGLEGVTGI